MNETLYIIQVLATIGVWIVVIWFSSIIRNLGKAVRMQKELMDSLQSQLDYVQTFHETVKTLYEPREIIKLINVKVENERIKFEREIIQEKQISKEKLASEKEMIKKYFEPLLRAHLMFISTASLFLPEKRIQQALLYIEDEEERKDLQDFITNMRKAVKDFIEQKKSSSKALQPTFARNAGKSD